MWIGTIKKLNLVASTERVSTYVAAERVKRQNKTIKVKQINIQHTVKAKSLTYLAFFFTGESSPGGGGSETKNKVTFRIL